MTRGCQRITLGRGDRCFVGWNGSDRLFSQKLQALRKPGQNVVPRLDFEAESAAILEATRRPSILLEVEESGCLEELGYVVDEYRGGDRGQGFDVFHLTGHATIRTLTPGPSPGGRGEKALERQEPAFITESAEGESVYSSAAEIYEPFRFAAPPLIWLSGCRTGQGVAEGNVLSMAEEALIGQGAQAVLGWGRPVGDRDATLAAAMLYDRLAAGCTLVNPLRFIIPDRMIGMSIFSGVLTVANCLVRLQRGALRLRNLSSIVKELSISGSS